MSNPTLNIKHIRETENDCFVISADLDLGSPDGMVTMDLLTVPGENLHKALVFLRKDISDTAALFMGTVHKFLMEKEED